MQTLEDLSRFAAGIAGADRTEDELRTLLQRFARVNPPREPEATYDYIVLGRSRGARNASRRPGHILLSWRRMFEVGPDVGVAGLGVGSSGAFGDVLIALYVWGKVWRGMEVEITDADASVVEALWRSGASKRGLPSDDVFVAVNALREERAVETLTRSQYERAINNLLSLGTVRLREDVVSLVEWVRKAT